jgi:PAS domain S-box-containing protein
MNFLGMIGRKQQRTNVIDEVGVAVVDGNFGLYGKMLFANKIFLKLLGYQTDEIQGKLIHQLMPSSIAEVHNIFWTTFA